MPGGLDSQRTVTLSFSQIVVFFGREIMRYRSYRSKGISHEELEEADAKSRA